MEVLESCGGPLAGSVAETPARLSVDGGLSALMDADGLQLNALQTSRSTAQENALPATVS